MATEQAARASSLVNFLGVNTHIDFQAYGYQDLGTTEAAIKYLGLKIIRDDPENPNDVGANGWWQQVANATGAKFDAFLAEGSPAQMEGDLTRAVQLAGQGILSAIEGGNEEDDPFAASNGNNLQIAAQYQATVFAAAQRFGLPAINMSFGQGWTAANNWEGDYGNVGNLAAYATYANAHTYPSGAPLTSIQLLDRDAGLAAAGRPVIHTELGYDTNSTNVVTAAKYDLDAIFDSLQQGNAGLYFYALFNDGSGNYGLMNSNGTPNAEGTAIHNLTTLLQDTGGNAGSFAAGSLTYTLGGAQGSDNTYLFEKSDGTYWLAIWNEQQALGASHNVTLQLGSAASRIVEYDPLNGTGATATVSGASSATISVPDHPVLVEIVPNGSTAGDPPGGTGSTGTGGTGTGSTGTGSTGGSAGDPPAGTGTGSGTGTTTPTTGPADLAVTVPASESVAAGGKLAITGVSIDDPWAAGMGGSMALNVYDKTGTITIAGKTFGPGGTQVANGMFSGTLAQLNADLSTLGYTAGAASGTDELTVDVWNQAGTEVTKTIKIGVTGGTSGTGTGGDPSGGPTGTGTGTGTGPTDLGVTVPAAESVAAGGKLAIAGVSISDPWAAGMGGSMALNVYDKTGTVTIAGKSFGPGGGKVAGGMFQGTLAQLNADLAGLGYAAGSASGTDTLTVDVWNQAGVESTKTITINVGAGGSGTGGDTGTTTGGNGGTTSGSGGDTGTGTGTGSTAPADVVVPTNQSSYYAIVSNQTISAAGRNQLIFIGGTGDTLTATGGSTTVQAFRGGDTITAGGGNNRIYYAGDGNTVDAGAGSNTLYDSGSNGTVVLNAGGNDTIYGYVLQNGDKLDLRGLLASTKWNGSTATIGDYVKVGYTAPNDAVISFAQSGSGAGSVVATLKDAGPVSMTTLLAHAIT